MDGNKIQNIIVHDKTDELIAHTQRNIFLVESFIYSIQGSIDDLNRAISKLSLRFMKLIENLQLIEEKYTTLANNIKVIDNKIDLLFEKVEMLENKHAENLD